MGLRFFAAIISAFFGTAYHVAVRVMPGLFAEGNALRYMGDTTGGAIDTIAMTWLVFFGSVVVVGIPVSYLLHRFRRQDILWYLGLMTVGFFMLSYGLEQSGWAFGGFSGQGFAGRYELSGSVNSIFLIIPFWYLVEGGPWRS